ncbi:MAG: hypothetical protein GX493_03745 [Firmicutes bacterium]|nr:hypothetical protein [Bacillota bacterium]
MGRIEVYIPREMAARVRFRQGLREIELQGEWRHTDGAYFSHDSRTARDRAEIEIEGV